MSELNTLANLLLNANELRNQRNYAAALNIYLQIPETVMEIHTPELFATIAACFSALAYTHPHQSGQNHDEAIRWMKRAIMIAPNNARYHSVLAQYYALGTLNYQQAAMEYRKSIELDPNDVWTLSSAASLYGVPDDVITLDEAIKWLERATQLEQDNPNYHFRLAVLYKEASRSQDAQREGLRALLCSMPLDSGPAQTLKKNLVIG